MAAVQETEDLGKAPVTQAVSPRPAAGTGGPKLLDRLREAGAVTLLPPPHQRQDDEGNKYGVPGIHISGVDLLEQPGHVLAEDLADQEEVVDRVEGVPGTGLPDRVRLLFPRLPLNHPPPFLSLPLESLWVGGMMAKDE